MVNIQPRYRRLEFFVVKHSFFVVGQTNGSILPMKGNRAISFVIAHPGFRGTKSCCTETG